jgi:hypothetical protein
VGLGYGEGMSDDKKTVPEPNEVRRDAGEVHYHDVDETNVRDADRAQKPRAEEAQQPEADA